MFEQDDRSKLDWDTYLAVESRASKSGKTNTELGDPMRWGGEVRTRITATGNESTPLTWTTGQILRAQVVDLYARRWQMSGQLVLPTALLNTNKFHAYLDITMGAGQSTLTHSYNVGTLIGLATIAGMAVLGNGIGFAVSDSLIAVALACRARYVLDTESGISVDDDVDLILLTCPRAIST